MKYLALLRGRTGSPSTSQKGMGTSLTKPTELPLPHQKDSLTERTKPVVSVLAISDPYVSSRKAVVTPNSRNQLISDAVRTVIEAIEGDARAQGWPAELLWNTEPWGSPRGLASVLDESDAISEVTRDYIEIVKSERSILRFQRRTS
jgi:hypothetical protein